MEPFRDRCEALPLKSDRIGLASPLQVEVFYDGDCPLCMREIRLLRKLDRHRRIGFVDIADPQFDAEEVGLSWGMLMARIHGRLPDGAMIEGVEVFRRLYVAVGFGRLVALSRLPVVSHFLDVAYLLFARYRLRLTGRCGGGQCKVEPPERRARSGVA